MKKKTVVTLIRRLCQGTGKEKVSLTPKERRETYGAFIASNESGMELKQGAERQWRRVNCRTFQTAEFNKKMKQLFGNKEDNRFKGQVNCGCVYCSGQRESELTDKNW